MSDLIDRLSEALTITPADNWKLQEEAAAELERLTKEIKIEIAYHEGQDTDYRAKRLEAALRREGEQA
jgi:hypothetical protein